MSSRAGSAAEAASPTWESWASLSSCQGVVARACSAERQKAKCTAVDSIAKVATVTVLGHIDHGKTSLLDRIMGCDSAGEEVGRITQRLKSYCVKYKGNKINLLDTPGHSLFESLRLNTMSVTDAVLLVVSISEGVMQQTRECAEYVTSWGLPVIIVYTKLDLGTARIMKTRTELLAVGLVVEGDGGQVPEVCVSASSGENVKQLMDMLCAMLDVGKPECDIGVQAECVILDVSVKTPEASMTSATMLVTAGAVVSGQLLSVGRRTVVVKFVSGAQYVIASMIETVLGLPDGVSIGQTVSVAAPASRLASAFLSALVKADTLSSIEGIKALLKAYSVKVISADVGSVTEANVNLAAAVGAVVIAFNTRVHAKALVLASGLNVTLIESDLIYEVASNIRAKLMVHSKASAKIVKVFRIAGRTVYGARLAVGVLRTGQTVAVRKLSAVAFHVTIKSIKRFCMPVDVVTFGQSFGFTTLESKAISIGDVIAEA